MARSTRVSAAAGSVQTANALPPSEQKEISALSRATARANEAEENVFLFVPNLIGYARIVLAALALIYMKSNPKACTLLYGVSCLLDAADGMAARALGQSSKFGAVLDMVTDRCTTSCLLCFLVTAYPRCALLFQALITLDFSSHYIHMYSSLITGSSSHKIVTQDVSRLLQHYYSPRWLFFYCAGNELFFVCLYLMDFYPTPFGLKPEWLLIPFDLLSPELSVSIAKTALNNPNSWAGVLFAAVRAATWPQLVGAVMGPICFAKQIFNAIQFWKAAKVLVGIDLMERAKAREEREK